MGKNMQRLGDTLNSRMRKTAGAAVPMNLELGIINDNLSLTTDSLRSPVPKGQYMVNILLTGEYQTSSEEHTHDGGSHTHSGGAHTQETGSGTHTHDGGNHSHSGGAHSHRLPEEFRALKSGDRVLVAWCGNEPVIIAVVKSS